MIPRQPDDPGPKYPGSHAAIYDRNIARMRAERDTWRTIAAVGWGFLAVYVVTRFIWP